MNTVGALSRPCSFLLLRTPSSIRVFHTTSFTPVSKSLSLVGSLPITTRRLPVVKSIFSRGNAVVGHQTYEHGPRHIVRASQSYQWRVFLDDVHFYIALGILLWGGLAVYANVFIGPAEIRDIPEGYEPKNYEYYRHPVTRWWVKMIDGPERNHEIMMHYVWEVHHKAKLNRLNKQIELAMHRNQDYGGWYTLQPIVGRQVFGAAAAREQSSQNQGNVLIPKGYKPFED